MNIYKGNWVMPPCDNQPSWQPGDVTHLVERPCSMLEVLVSTASTMWAVLSCCGAGRGRVLGSRPGQGRLPVQLAREAC